MRKGSVLALPSECVEELKKGSQPTQNLLVAEARPSIGAILNINGYTTQNHLLCVTACVLKEVKFFNDAAKQREIMLSPAGLTETEKWKILCAQGTLTDDKNIKHLPEQNS